MTTILLKFCTPMRLFELAMDQDKNNLSVVTIPYVCPVDVRVMFVHTKV